MTRIYCQSIAGVLALLAVLAAPVRAQDGKAPDYAAIVAAPDRAEADRQADVRRKPAQLLAFTEVKSGMKVLDMETSAGYSAELLARSVGPAGTIYAQDSAAVIERFVKDKFDIRARMPVMKNVVHGWRSARRRAPRVLRGWRKKLTDLPASPPAAAFPFPVITVRTTISASSGGM